MSTVMHTALQPQFRGFQNSYPPSIPHHSQPHSKPLPIVQLPFRNSIHQNMNPQMNHQSMNRNEYNYGQMRGHGQQYGQRRGLGQRYDQRRGHGRQYGQRGRGYGQRRGRGQQYYQKRGGFGRGRGRVRGRGRGHGRRYSTSNSYPSQNFQPQFHRRRENFDQWNSTSLVSHIPPSYPTSHQYSHINQSMISNVMQPPITYNTQQHMPSYHNMHHYPSTFQDNGYGRGRGNWEYIPHQNTHHRSHEQQRKHHRSHHRHHSSHSKDRHHRHHSRSRSRRSKSHNNHESDDNTSIVIEKDVKSKDNTTDEIPAPLPIPHEQQKNERIEKTEDVISIHAQLLISRISSDIDIKQTENIKETTNESQSETDDEIDRKCIEKRKTVDYNKFSSHKITVKGDNLPSKMHCFTDCPLLTKEMLENLKHEQFTKPTPVQQQCIPVVLQNRDLMACAQTGSGKTLAFLLPIIAMLIKAGDVNRVFFPGKNACAQPLALILGPTRELTIQIDEQVYKMTRNTWIRSFAVFGGDNYQDQAKEIGKRQIDILSATPGRLMDMVVGCKISLEYIKHLAFDEADNMLDLGFKNIISQIVHERGMPSKEERQTVMFSATFPDDIRELAKDFMKPFVFVRVDNLCSVASPITQTIKWVEEKQKMNHLFEDVSVTVGKIIVFCSRRQIAEVSCNYLQDKGISVGCLHGHMNQLVREETILQFKDDVFRVLCATSVAARGLDFPFIEKVINLDMPPTIENYMHRIGRTGRIGNLGNAVSYFNFKNGTRIVPELIGFLKKSKQNIPHWLLSIGQRAGNERKR